MRDGLKIFVLMAAIGACGDDGVGSDGTTDGTGTTGTSGPSTSSPSTSLNTDTTTETAEGSGSSDGSTTNVGSESGSGDTGSGSEGSTGSSGSGSGSDSTGSNETASVCTPIDFTPVLGAAFNGSGGCEGVMTNAVLDDAMAVGDHHDAYCETAAMCMDPDPECPPQPAIEIEGNRVVYVMGQASGCSASAAISEILDCGDEVEVHWSISGIGLCATVVNGWDSALIPDGPEVVFVQE